MSTGFWLADRPLTHRNVGSKSYYLYNHPKLGAFYMPYVGIANTIDEITLDALMRVSLARWWAPQGVSEKRCYLQLSGWYI